MISAEGVDQLAAMMPRTNSELLLADTMSLDKVRRFGPLIMDVLRPFWHAIDQREHTTMVRQLEVLKNQQIRPAANDGMMTSRGGGATSSGMGGGGEPVENLSNSPLFAAPRGGWSYREHKTFYRLKLT